MCYDDPVLSRALYTKYIPIVEVVYVLNRPLRTFEVSSYAKNNRIANVQLSARAFVSWAFRVRTTWWQPRGRPRRQKSPVRLNGFVGIVDLPPRNAYYGRTLGNLVSFVGT